ncbi:biotin-dependent carboxyltransferase family protein [Pseudomonas luteola]|uniref:5-oxoprolinase subunit C family protein n=1 Tax=Pseudomonas luteola TaxID=47886 RepID=UPI001EF4C02F|nr:biotin-dependent carboxyltransferase family protein [Pseudomonas luteola]MCG7373409.1 biotin-dependent carboxyltransferase family protein [Pseudomonas luteola]
MKGLKVIKPGPLSLLQDVGRYGWRHLGVSTSGPMDRQAAAWSNHLLENSYGSPVLEIALGGVELEAQVDTWLALTGAPLGATVDGQTVPAWSRFCMKAGQRLQLGFAQAGQRAYLGVVGGFRGKAVLGSVATHRREGLGGLNGDGQALQADDILVCSPGLEAFDKALGAASRFIPDYRESPVLRLVVGGDGEAFAVEQRDRFFGSSWRISPQADRMGIRLQGDAPLAAPVRQWSLGVLAGAVQVPPEGQPIVLMADCQTMGGYPVLGFVHPLDLCRLAQCPAHHEVRFRPIELEEAQGDLKRFYRFFKHHEMNLCAD